ncbi:MAG: 2-amino-4-hydroxy-6-hydroxymethyldihydropteridine diphosphokinase [Proteobacteria bacterium]|nr:MAG: 2-amino-4-hydroxy-6-hydroxymethyldihydropteridine diphosphokinase [Pseudomonadota bacterium]
MTWTQCYIGLGSNLGDSEETLTAAIAVLADHASIRNLSISSFYQSKPHGPQDQPDYTNAVAGFETCLAAEPLLDLLQSIETQHGRVRSGEQWTARTLDLDILLFGQQQIETARLQVPHPWMKSREFVLYPLYELEPALCFPDGSTLAESLTGVSENDLVRLAVKPLLKIAEDI